MGNGEQGAGNGDQGDGKPDLSELKSRLGLDRKPSGEDRTDEERETGKKTGRTETKQETTGSSSESSDAPKRQPKTPQGPPPAQQSDLSSEEVKAVGSSMFSGKMIAFVVIAALLAGIVGVLAGQSMKTRELVQAQRDDASRIRDALGPLVENYKKAKKKLDSLDLDRANFEAARTLAELEIAPGTNLLGGQRLLLGNKAIDYITAYASEARMLENLLQRHDRLTNEIDKSELEALMKDEKVADKGQYAVLFDYKNLARQSQRDGYIPKSGAVIRIPSEYQNDEGQLEPDDDGKVLAKRLASTKERKVHVRSLIPIPRENLVRTGGPNALQRYQERVGGIRRHAKKMSKYVDDMLQRLEKIENRESAPLIQL